MKVRVGDEGTLERDQIIANNALCIKKSVEIDDDYEDDKEKVDYDYDEEYFVDDDDDDVIEVRFSCDQGPLEGRFVTLQRKDCGRLGVKRVRVEGEGCQA